MSNIQYKSPTWRQRVQGLIRRSLGLRNYPGGNEVQQMISDVRTMQRDFPVVWECIRELQAALNIQTTSQGAIQFADGITFDFTFERLAAMAKLGFSPRVIADVGASDGSWTRQCLNIFPEARYYCVEPLNENQLALHHLSTEHPQVNYWIGGLGSAPARLTLNANSNGSSLLNAPDGTHFGTPREIQVETLDNLVNSHGFESPDLLKLDVQGYELEVLKGAQQSLKTTQVILLEVSYMQFQQQMPIFHEVISALAAYGFVVYDIVSMLPRPYDNAPAQSDVVFVRPEHILRKTQVWG